jgi:hypothetical protein
MRKLLPSGRGYFTIDHPYEVIREGVMRFAEIRAWMSELKDNPDYGWGGRGGTAGLERALGLDPAQLIRKIRTHWIFPKEQFRLTKRIEDILQGYIVPHRYGIGRVDGVFTDPPVPPTIRERKMLSLRVTVRGISQAPAREAPQIPSFGTVFDHVSYWDPDKNARERKIRRGQIPLKDTRE